MATSGQPLPPWGSPPSEGALHEEQSRHSYRVNFPEMQRIRSRQLQHKLVQHAVDLRYDALEPPGWADLRQYGAREARAESHASPMD